MIFKNLNPRLKKVFFLLILAPIYWGASVRCSGEMGLGGNLFQPTQLNAGGGGSGDTRTDGRVPGEDPDKPPTHSEETTPLPLIIPPPSPAASGASGAADGGGSGGPPTIAAGTNSQPTQTAEGTDPEGNQDGKYERFPCPPVCPKALPNPYESGIRPELLSNEILRGVILSEIQATEEITNTVQAFGAH